jgi:hypothetical protein
MALSALVSAVRNISLFIIMSNGRNAFSGLTDLRSRALS